MKNLIQGALVLIALLLVCIAIFYIVSGPKLTNPDTLDYIRHKVDPEHVELPMAESLTQCGAAPFVVPTDGWIGVLYADSILGTVNHSGLDIFGLEGNGVTPIYAAYDGYLTRLPEWTSAVIIRHPEDPLNPGQQIWTYYTHMADADGNSYILPQIPAGTYELPVKQGSLLGYQGDYTSKPWGVDTHLHFSIVRDNDGQFLNETDIDNTIDPSPYIGMRLNTTCGDRPPVCRPDFYCP